MTNYERIAEKMYSAYCQQAGGVTFDGKPLPSFQELGLERQSCWIAAAKASKMVAPSNLKQLADSFPELNPSNYDAEDVDKLHNWALEVVQAITAIDQEVAHGAPAQTCTCPSGDGSLRWPCPAHPPSAAPVVWPEPIGYAHQGQLDNISDGYAYVYPMESPSTSCKLYTEQQVRELLDNSKRSTNRDDESVGLLEALVRAHNRSQADSQSKGGHETFDLMMLREERNAIKSALDESPQPQADALDAELLDWLEGEVCNSYTGLTITRIDHREEGMVIERGFRLRRFHKDYEVKPTLRAAIAAAKENK